MANADGSQGQAPDGDAPGEARPLPTLSVSGVILTKAQLMQALQIYFPGITDFSPLPDGDHFSVLFAQGNQQPAGPDFTNLGPVVIDNPSGQALVVEYSNMGRAWITRTEPPDPIVEGIIVTSAYIVAQQGYAAGSGYFDGGTGISILPDGNIFTHGAAQIDGILTSGTITVLAQDAVNEGGQVIWNGAGANPFFYIDNFQGNLRVITKDGPTSESEKIRGLPMLATYLSTNRGGSI